MKKTFKRVGLFGSDYSLMIYLLYASKDEIDETFFVFNNGIPLQVRKYFKNQCFDITTLPKPKILREMAEILLHFTKYLRWPFMRTAEFWGMPIVGIEILGSKKIHQIEEGCEHLGLACSNHRKLKSLRRLLHGWWYENYTLDNPKIVSLVLTRPLKHKTNENCKQIVIDLNDKWRTNLCGRQILLDSHGISQSEIDNISECKYLLLSQTFTEDGMFPLEREIELYKQLIGNINLHELVIKPHPREHIEKKSFFPGATIFATKCPIQLLAYCGFKPRTIFTVCSTSVYTLPYTDVEIKFLGTECDERLVKRFGIIKAKS